MLKAFTEMLTSRLLKKCKTQKIIVLNKFIFYKLRILWMYEKHPLLNRTSYVRQRKINTVSDGHGTGKEVTNKGAVETSAENFSSL